MHWFPDKTLPGVLSSDLRCSSYWLYNLAWQQAGWDFKSEILQKMHLEIFLLELFPPCQNVTGPISVPFGERGGSYEEGFCGDKNKKPRSGWRGFFRSSRFKMTLTEIKCLLFCWLGSFHVRFTVSGSSKQIWSINFQDFFWRGHPSPKSCPWALSHTDTCQTCHECVKHHIWLAKLTGFWVVPVVDFILCSIHQQRKAEGVPDVFCWKYF